MVEFGETTIRITDRIEKTGNMKIQSLVSGIKFSSIHMASSRYFTPSQLDVHDPKKINIDALQKDGFIERNLTLDLNKPNDGKKDA